MFWDSHIKLYSYLSLQVGCDMCRVRWFHKSCVPPHLLAMQVGQDLMCEICLLVIAEARGVSSAVQTTEAGPGCFTSVAGTQPALCTTSEDEEDLKIPTMKPVRRKQPKTQGPSKTQKDTNQQNHDNTSCRIVNNPTNMDAALAGFVPAKPWRNPMAPFKTVWLKKRVKVCRGCRGNFACDGSMPFLILHKENNPFRDWKSGLQKDSYGNGIYCHCALACILPRHPYFQVKNLIVDMPVSTQEREFLSRSGIFPWSADP